ncbi:MAG TPA: hypothetical protein VLN25_11770, partial [Burkholderiaceae bacterium]|nr:hypothetical protein [Burkholderiaceae bacterium]
MQDVALPVKAPQEVASLSATAASLDFDLGDLDSDAERPAEGADVRSREAATDEEDSVQSAEAAALEMQFELPELVPPDEDVVLEAIPVESSGIDDEDVRRIGPLEISHGLYSVFLNEADECVRVLAHDINEWRYEPSRPVSAQVVRRAHSLSGISKTVGLLPVIAISDPLDDLMHTLSMLSGPRHYALTAPQFDTLERVIEHMRGMLHQFAAGVYPDEAPLDAGALQDVVAIVRAHSALHDELTPVVVHPSATREVEAPQWANITLIEPTPSEAGDLAAAQPAPLVDAVSTADTVAVSVVEAAAPVVVTEAIPVYVPTPAANVPDVPAKASAASPIEVATVAETEAEVAAATRVRDELDADLLQVFLAEAADLLPSIGT